MVTAPLKCLKMFGNVGEEPLAILMVLTLLYHFHFISFASSFRLIIQERDVERRQL